MLATVCVYCQREQAWVLVALLNLHGVKLYITAKSAHNSIVANLESQLTASKRVLSRGSGIIRNLNAATLEHRVVVEVDI